MATLMQCGMKHGVANEEKDKTNTHANAEGLKASSFLSFVWLEYEAYLYWLCYATWVLY